MLFLYGFFDYKGNIQGFSSDLFSPMHFVFIAYAIISTILVAIFARKANHKHIDLILKIASIWVLVLEITKISWESYYDISGGHGFNKIGIIPVYTCSLYIYTMLLAAWTKGKVKEYSLSFLTTVSVFSGFVGIIYCNGLNWYPFWTFGAFYSMFFHYSMLLTGVFLLATKYKKLEWIDAIKGWIPMCILALLAIPIDYEYGADYMQLYNAGGVPLLSNLAKALAGLNIRFVYTIIMLLLYITIGALVIGLYKLVKLIIESINKNKATEEAN